MNNSKLLNIALWAAQALLAAMFLMAGFIKTTTPIEELSATLPWAKDIPEGLVRFIGASEFLAAIGLLLPSLLRIRPILTPLAALGIATVMFIAVLFHISRGEISVIGFNIGIMTVALFIALGRLMKMPVQPKINLVK